METCSLSCIGATIQMKHHLYSNETSSAFLLHATVCFLNIFYKINFFRIFLILNSQGIMG